MATNYEVRPCLNHLGSQTGWDICPPADPDARGCTVIATVYESEEVARILAEALSVWNTRAENPDEVEQLRKALETAERALFTRIQNDSYCDNAVCAEPTSPNCICRQEFDTALERAAQSGER